jgi:hypothetical protein
MTKEAMLNLIKKHNDVVQFIGTLGDVKVSAEVVMRLMPMSRKIASLGLALTHEAREIGIDAKCCMQSGEISIYQEANANGKE